MPILFIMLMVYSVATFCVTLVRFFWTHAVTARSYSKNDPVRKQRSKSMRRAMLRSTLTFVGAIIIATFR